MPEIYWLPYMNSEKLFQTQFKDYIEIAEYMHIDVDIESFWTEDYAGQIPNRGLW